MSAGEDRTVVVADGTVRRGAPHEKEARRAHLFICATRLQCVAIGGPVFDFLLFVILVGLVFGRNKAILQNRVEVGLDVVGGRQVFVVFVFGCTSSDGNNLVLFLLGVLDECLVIVELVAFSLETLFVELFRVDFIRIEVDLFFDDVLDVVIGTVDGTSDKIVVDVVALRGRLW